MIKKICVFTGNRADYGILKPLINKLKFDKDFILQLVISGSHLCKEYGFTFNDIDISNIEHVEKTEIQLSSDTPIGTIKSMGLGLISFSEIISKLKPDLCFILGDRFEALSFAIACYVCNIAIAHLHGGELTEGVLDDGFRHSITKLSYLHFTSTEEYRKRVIQLGEEPERVFNVGALTIENIKNTKFLSKKELERKLNIKFKKNNFVITFHPSTLESNYNANDFKELIRVLDELDNSLLIFTKANCDPGGKLINSIIYEFVSKNNDKATLFDSLGDFLYLNVLKYVDAVVGNSSSGIIEAPYFKIPTINIGDRQKGRIKAESIIDCKSDYNDIKNAFKYILSNDLKNKLRNIKNPYGDGNTSDKIIKIIKNIKIASLKKSFYNLK